MGSGSDNHNYTNLLFEDKKLQVTVSIPDYVENQNHTLFINQLLSAGYQLAKAKTLAKKEVAQTLEYLKVYHGVEYSVFDNSTPL